MNKETFEFIKSDIIALRSDIKELRSDIKGLLAFKGRLTGIAIVTIAIVTVLSQVVIKYVSM